MRWFVLCLILCGGALSVPVEAAQVFADRVRETTVTTGTGTVTLAGAVTSYRTFNTGIATGNSTYYCIVHRTAAEWECGLGTVVTSTTLSRTTVLSSSTGSAVSLSAGTKDVFAGVLSQWYSYFPPGAPTDDAVLVGNGTLWQFKAIPNCPTGGIGYTAATNTFGCNAITGGSVPTGTGFTHITAGAQDAAAKLVAIADHSATGTPSAATFYRGDNTWSTPAGSGTVTATGGALTSNAVMLGAGSTDSKVLASLGTTATLLHGNAAGAPTFGAVVSADLSITATTCTNQFVSAISSAAAGTCTTDTLASAQHANQGTTTQVLHGNAAGNPSWGAVALGTDVSGTLLAAQFPALTGDVTTSAGALATTLANIPTGTPAVGTILHTNIAAPSSPAAGKVSVYSDSTDLRLHDKNASGVIGTTVVADAGASNNFLTAISAAGAISKAQPAFTNLSGSVAAGQMPAHTGDVTSSAGSVALALANIPTATPMAGSLLATAIAAPSTPAAGKGSIYIDSTSKNIAIKDDAGVVKHGVATSTCGGSTFVQGVSDAGVLACATPSGSGNVSNSGTPTAGQIAQWTNATTVQGITLVPVASGGTNLASGTSGGVLAYTANGTLASSGALTANLPVIGGGAGVVPTVGTRSGNTTAYVTTTGTQTSGDCVKIDAAGNHIANGSACGGGSGPTITTFAAGSPADASTTFQVNSLTTRSARYFTIPGSITLNQITIGINTVTTAGTIKVCIYSADGATKLVDVTTGTPATTTPLSTAVGAVALAAGEYYAVVGCATTCSNTVFASPVEMGAIAAGMFGQSTPAGKKPWHGVVTHTSGTCNSTLGTVTGNNTTQPVLRGDQ